MDGPFAWYLAGQLHDAAAGRAVERIDVAPGRWQANVMLMHCAGQVLQRVHARGKWLIFDFAHGVTWLCCLVGRAKWVVRSPVNDAASGAMPSGYSPTFATPTIRPRGRAKRPAAAMRPGLLEIHFREAGSLQLFGRPLLFTLPIDLAMKHPELTALGPDVAAETFDLEDALYRIRQNPQKTAAAALLDQHIVSGLGNALKCQTLFAARLPPGQKLHSLYASELSRLVAHARAAGQDALLALRQGQPIRYAVYDRLGEPCPACGADIQADRSGVDGRWTWHCPVCQRLPETPGLFG